MIKKILIRRKNDLLNMELLFIDSEYNLFYNNGEFNKVNIQSINSINSFEEVSFSMSCFGQDIVEIREDEDFDNYFILLSNNTILRIHVTLLNDEIQEVLVYHPFKENNKYYLTLKKQLLLSNVLDVN